MMEKEQTVTVKLTSPDGFGQVDRFFLGLFLSLTTIASMGSFMLNIKAFVPAMNTTSEATCTHCSCSTGGESAAKDQTAISN